ncbi:c-type cytochrome biogenesis protein CcmI [Rhodopila sp.]|uniref:c-type cytochrome biogenesis protein CcmI n=1 Tax=Rhodopila sp. TaxID=2480087 RepID=UPI003D0CA9E4
MILPFLLAALAFVTLLAIVAPLLRGNRPVPERANFDQAVYRDQLHELDRDIARGLLTPDEASAARLEIQRRLLATDRLASAPARLSRSPVLAGAVFVVITAGSLGVYLWIGAPGLPDEPFASRQAAMASADAKDRLSMQQAADRLAAKLQANPSDPQGWLLFARAESMLNRWDQAADAYRHAMTLGQTGPEVTAAYAEMLVLTAGGTVTPAAEAAFRQVLAADQNSGVARYYLAIAASQAGEPRKAIDMLQALLAGMPSDSPLRGQIGQRIADAAQAAHIPVPELANGTAPAAASSPGPDANTVASAANMTDAQRQAMVTGMVARLAAKQAADPNNLDGWLQLGRAYTVLHEPDKAADAFDKAASLKPGDVSIPLQAVRALLADQKPTARLPPRVVDLLKRVEATDPQEPMVLWFLGMAAVQDRQPQEARRYWGTLLAKLPPASEDARMVQAALDTLSQAAKEPGG